MSKENKKLKEPKNLKVQTPELEQFISLAEASELCSYSQEYLSLLARKGLIGAVKMGRNWVITRDVLFDYVQKNAVEQKGNHKGRLVFEEAIRNFIDQNWLTVSLPELASRLKAKIQNGLSRVAQLVSQIYANRVQLWQRANGQFDKLVKPVSARLSVLKNPLVAKRVMAAILLSSLGALSLYISPVAAKYYQEDFELIAKVAKATIGKSYKAAAESFNATAEIYADTLNFIKNPEQYDFKTAGKYLGQGFVRLGSDIAQGSVVMSANFSETFFENAWQKFYQVADRGTQVASNLIVSPANVRDILLALTDFKISESGKLTWGIFKPNNLLAEFFDPAVNTYAQLGNRVQVLVAVKVKPTVVAVGNIFYNKLSRQAEEAVEPRVAGVYEEAQLTNSQLNGIAAPLAGLGARNDGANTFLGKVKESFSANLSSVGELGKMLVQGFAKVPAKAVAFLQECGNRSAVISQIFNRVGNGFNSLASLSLNKFDNQVVEIVRLAKLAYHNIFYPDTRLVSNEQFLTLQEVQALLGQITTSVQYVTVDGKTTVVVGRVGPRGAAGQAGPQGQPGTPGLQGAQGPAGANGTGDFSGNNGVTYYGNTPVYNNTTVFQSISAVESLAVGKGGIGTGGNLTVAGSAYFGTNANDTFNVVGPATFQNSLTAGSLTTVGSASIGTSLNVTGATTLAGNLSVGGMATITAANGNITTEGNITTGGSLTVGGNLSLTGSLTGATTTLTATGTNTILTVRQGGTGDLFNAYDGGTEVFTIIDGGNVGIGTSTPSATLAIQSTQGQTQDLFRIGTSSNASLPTTTDASFFSVSASGKTTIKGGVLDPTFLAKLNNPGGNNEFNGATDVKVVGDYAYVLNVDRASLAVVDVSDPADPVFVAEERGPGPGTYLDDNYKLEIAGHYAYIADYSGNLVIIDISNPADPVFVKAFSSALLNGAIDVKVVGRYAYVANNLRDSLAVVDVSDPYNPVLVAEERGAVPGTTLNNPYALEIAGNYVYMVNYNSDSLAVLDISNPADPVLVAQEFGPVPGTSLNQPVAIQVTGQYAYISVSSSDDIAVVDISNPADPVYVTQVPCANPASCALGRIFAVGNYLYATDSTRDSLVIYDISNPAAPVIVAEEFGPVPGTTLDLVVSVYVDGNYAYLTCSGTCDSLIIIDVSGLVVANAQIDNLKVDRLHVQSRALFADSLLIQGGLNVERGAMFNGPVSINVSTTTSIGVSAFKINATSSAALVDLRQYGTGNILSLYSSSTLALSVRNSGQTIFSALPANTKPALLIQPYNISSFNTASSSMLTVNAAPGFTGDLLSLQLDGAPKFRIDYQGNAVYNSSAVYAGDVDPDVDNQYDIGDLLTTKRWRDIALYRNLSVGAIDNNGKVVRISSTTIAVYNTDLTIQTNNSQDILLNPTGNRVGIGTTTPAATLAIKSQQGQTQDLFRIGTSSNTILTTTTNASFFSVSASGKTTIKGGVLDPVFLAEERDVTTLNKAFKVVVQGNYAYVATQERDSLAVIDISNPNNPVFISEEQGPNPGVTLNEPYDLYVAGNYAYMVHHARDSLSIINISNPYDPVFVAEYRHATNLDGPIGVRVMGKYAYVANNLRDSLAVIDITNPSNPVFVAEERGLNPGVTLNGAYSLDISANYAYVANYTNGSLAVIDISNPSNPVFISEEQHASLAGAIYVRVQEKYAYVGSDTNNSLVVVDISNPTDPTIVAVEKGPIPGTSLGGIHDIFVSGNYAYTANRNRDSLAVIDISDPSNPVFVAEERGTTPGSTLDGIRSVYVAGNYAYTANSERDSLAVIDLSGLTVANAEIGSLKVANFMVDGYAQFAQGALVQGALNVSRGAMFGGSVAINLSTSSSVGIPAFKATASTTVDLVTFSQQGTGKILGLYDGVSTNNANLAFGVYDGGYAQLNATSTATALSIRQASTGDILNVFDGATEVLTILDGGFVGIGNSAPDSLLHVRSAAAADSVLIIDTISASQDSYLSLREAGTEKWKIRNVGDNGDRFHIGNPSATFLTILQTGKVGIGDDNPDQLLEVMSSSAANTQITVSNTNGGDYDSQIGFELADGTNTFTIGVDDSDSDKFKISTTGLGTNDRLVIDSSGYVGISTSTPYSVLSVSTAAQSAPTTKLF
ncbi:MAG: hypothetical protein Q8P32_05095, partial [Candidatus Komeilibacteria bacterium]|nr:hypothetical protein [Candidatus Komeilibacteria bacterium]